MRTCSHSQCCVEASKPLTRNDEGDVSGTVSGNGHAVEPLYDAAAAERLEARHRSCAVRGRPPDSADCAHDTTNPEPLISARCSAYGIV